MLFKIILFVFIGCAIFAVLYFKDGFKKEVVYERIVDGDTMYFTIDGISTKCRLIGIDTPEIDTKEDYAFEAKEFSDELLRNASRIEIEYDKQAGIEDKYERQLVYVFVDDILLEEALLKEGLAKIEYVYGDYKYLSRYKVAQKIAQDSHLNLWEEQ